MPGSVRASQEYLLYIDDSLASRALIRSLVESSTDFVVLAVENGNDGLNAARLYQPTAILLDLNLVDETGESVLVRLKDDPETAHIPVIVVSVERDPARLAESVRLGAIATVLKGPHMLDDIRTAVGAVR